MSSVQLSNLPPLRWRIRQWGQRDEFELRPTSVPGAVTSIALIATGPELPVGIDTGIRLVTPDARAAHEDLLARGLSVGELLDWDIAPLMFSFSDPDGNRLYAAESD